MSEKENSIIEEQRKAREEFLRLKKMQRGEITQEEKAKVSYAPKTFGEKLKNFWYHFKVQTILVVCLTAIIAIATVQCATREKYDFSILYFVFEPTIDSQLDATEKYFEKYAEDVNGDGEVNIQVINCSVSDSNRDAGRNTMFAKVQSIIASEKSTVLYLVDDKAVKYFEDALGYSIFTEEPITLGDEFYGIASNKDLPLPEGLKLGLRIIEGTTFENDTEAKTAFSASEKTFKKICNANNR